MNLQRKILSNYFETFGREMTLRQISNHLGIQITRVFRILNGYEMKISEYEKFKSLTSCADPSSKKELAQMAIKGERIFSLKLNDEMKKILELKIRLQDTIAK